MYQKFYSFQVLASACPNCTSMSKVLTFLSIIRCGEMHPSKADSTQDKAECLNSVVCSKRKVLNPSLLILPWLYAILQWVFHLRRSRILWIIMTSQLQTLTLGPVFSNNAPSNWKQLLHFTPPVWKVETAHATPHLLPQRCKDRSTELHNEKRLYEDVSQSVSGKIIFSTKY